MTIMAFLKILGLVILAFMFIALSAAYLHWAWTDYDWSDAVELVGKLAAVCILAVLALLMIEWAREIETGTDEERK